MKQVIDISIICPVYNEREHLSSLASTFLADDGIKKEVFFVDAGSDDGSVEYIKTLSEKDSRINLVQNPSKYVNHGFNMAYPVTSGRYIALLGAHSNYPGNFFRIGFEALEKNECDAVGGPLKQIGRGIVGEAIAESLSSRFGVGNTEFRVFKKRMFVDSVAFAIYKKKVFEEIGLLDKDLIKNQDDEFHYRLNKAGFKILMLPEMEVEYFVRNSLAGLIKQYFNYGLFKPLVLKKIGNVVSIRHFVPALFVLYLLSLPLCLYSMLWLIPLTLYVFIDLFFSMKAAGGIKVKAFSFIIFPVIHVSYGLGFILGLN